MKNFKKITLAVMVAALAVGFSAFTNAPKPLSLTNTYYNNRPDHAPSTSASDFIFVDNDVDRCDTDPSDQCTAQWTTANAPMVGQTPAQAGSPSNEQNATLGDFDGNIIP